MEKKKKSSTYRDFYTYEKGNIYIFVPLFFSPSYILLSYITPFSLYIYKIIIINNNNNITIFILKKISFYICTHHTRVFFLSLFNQNKQGKSFL